MCAVLCHLPTCHNHQIHFFTCRERSLINRLKRIAPKTELCGIPNITESSEESDSKQWFTTSTTSTTAVFSYAIGPRKLSANEKFFVGAETVVSLLQAIQIMSDVCCLRQLK